MMIDLSELDIPLIRHALEMRSIEVEREYQTLLKVKHGTFTDEDRVDLPASPVGIAESGGSVVLSHHPL